MPSQLDIDDRFGDLVAQLREAPPAASDPLRERVRKTAQAAAAEPVVRRPRRRPTLRFALPLAAGLSSAAAIAIAVATVDTGGSSENFGSAASSTELRQAPDADAASGEDAGAFRVAPEAAAGQRSLDPILASPSRARGAALPGPAPRRLQRYRAELRVRVDSLGELSSATATAMRTTRSLGGYVVTGAFDAPVGEDGDSLLVVRVPVGRVQEAIARFSELGTIVAQAIQIEDAQAQVNRQTEGLRALRGTIRRLERQLARTDLALEERLQLEARLTDARLALGRLLDAREATVAGARLARVALTLTTRTGEVAPPTEPGELESTLRDALNLLAQVLTWVLAALIVAAPFIVLAAIGVVLERRRRRRATEQLLERA